MKFNQAGFTLIEILVVVAIGVSLLAVGSFSAISVLQQGDISAEQANIDQFRLAFQLYRETTGQYPPGEFNAPADSCSLCDLRDGSDDDAITAAQAEWDIVVNALAPQYMSEESIATDTWGNPYAYSNNFGVSNADHLGAANAKFYTVLCSMGPDSELQTFLTTDIEDYMYDDVAYPAALGDDICFFTL